MFRQTLESVGVQLVKKPIEILQVNVGRLCNLTCSHCHVESGPTKTKENMDRRTAEAVIRFLDKARISTLDLTGGAPEMNPHFRYLVTEARERGVQVMDRCNLSVMLLDGQEDLADFLAANQIEVIASLPCYSRENVDRQRGTGTFEASIEALRRLNRLGYGREGSGRTLNLVYNPVGPHLPPPQAQLEQDYKERLLQDFGILFNRLYTITNMVITRYAAFLRAQKQDAAYQHLLIQSFNPATLEGLMCRNTLNVGWDGTLYDCDFNFAIGLRAGGEAGKTIFNLEPDDLLYAPIATGEHCFGCTAGAGSSCQGALESA